MRSSEADGPDDPHVMAGNSPAKVLASSISIAIEKLVPNHSKVCVASPLLDAVSHMLTTFGISIEQNLSTLLALIIELQTRLDALESAGRMTRADIAKRLSDPQVKRMLFEAATIALDPNREEISLILADLLMERIERKENCMQARYQNRAIRVMDDISTDQILIVALVTFLVQAQGITGHHSSLEAHGALLVSDFARYDHWLEQILKRLVPPKLDLEDFNDLVALGLLEIPQHAEVPGTMPKHASAIDTLIMQRGIVAAQAHKEAIWPSIAAATALLHPIENMRLSTTVPILSRYWPTPLGLRIAEPLLRKFTDLGSRNAEEGS